MNLPEFHVAIEQRVASWAIGTLYIADNEPALTKDQHEFIQLRVIDGIGIGDETTGGLRGVKGDSVIHVFLLQFDIYIKLNTSKVRAYELAQMVLDHWQVQDLGNGLYLNAGSTQRIGEEAPFYRLNVTVPGAREEILTK